MSRAAHVGRAAFVWTLLGFATLNAVSYFVRSSPYSEILLSTVFHVEAIGFPLLVWKETGFVGGFYLSYSAAIANVCIALGASTAVGFIAAWWARRSLPVGRPSAPQTSPAVPYRPLQFTLRTLLIVTLGVAMVAGYGQTGLPVPEAVLGVIYLAGPGVIALLAYRWRSVVPGQRVACLAATTWILIVGIVALGGRQHGASRILLGLFVWWTPQSILIPVIARIGRTISALPTTAPGTWDTAAENNQDDTEDDK